MGLAVCLAAHTLHRTEAATESSQLLCGKATRGDSQPAIARGDRLAALLICGVEKLAPRLPHGHFGFCGCLAGCLAVFLAVFLAVLLLRALWKNFMRGCFSGCLVFPFLLSLLRLRFLPGWRKRLGETAVVAPACLPSCLPSSLPVSIAGCLDKVWGAGWGIVCVWGICAGWPRTMIVAHCGPLWHRQRSRARQRSPRPAMILPEITLKSPLNLSRQSAEYWNSISQYEARTKYDKVRNKIKYEFYFSDFFFLILSIFF